MASAIADYINGLNADQEKNNVLSSLGTTALGTNVTVPGANPWVNFGTNIIKGLIGGGLTTEGQNQNQAFKDDLANVVVPMIQGKSIEQPDDMEDDHYNHLSNLADIFKGEEASTASDEATAEGIKNGSIKSNGQGGLIYGGSSVTPEVAAKLKDYGIDENSTPEQLKTALQVASLDDTKAKIKDAEDKASAGQNKTNQNITNKVNSTATALQLLNNLKGQLGNLGTGSSTLDSILPDMAVGGLDTIGRNDPNSDASTFNNSIETLAPIIASAYSQNGRPVPIEQIKEDLKQSGWAGPAALGKHIDNTIADLNLAAQTALTGNNGGSDKVQALTDLLNKGASGQLGMGARGGGTSGNWGGDPSSVTTPPSTPGPGMKWQVSNLGNWRQVPQ